MAAMMEVESCASFVTDGDSMVIIDNDKMDEEVITFTTNDAIKDQEITKPKRSRKKKVGDRMNGAMPLQVFQNGDSYLGEWEDNKPHGRGTFTFLASKYEYSGDWLYGKMTGKGKITWNDGSSYEGDFLENQLTGKGIMKYPDGNVYEGEFVDGIHNGFGKFTWKQGDVYEGNWKNGLKEGTGTYRFPSGKIYSGGYKNNRRHGDATYTFPTGVKFEGLFEDGKRVSTGRYILLDGSVAHFYEDKIEDNNDANGDESYDQTTVKVMAIMVENKKEKKKCVIFSNPVK